MKRAGRKSKAMENIEEVEVLGSGTALRVEEDPEPPYPEPAKTPQKEKMWRCKIFSSESEAGDVDITVNGKNIRIKRGEYVTIPERFVGVLRDSVVDTFTMDPETGVKKTVSVLRYPCELSPAS